MGWRVPLPYSSHRSCQSIVAATERAAVMDMQTYHGPGLLRKMGGFVYNSDWMSWMPDTRYLDTGYWVLGVLITEPRLTTQYPIPSIQ